MASNGTLRLTRGTKIAAIASCIVLAALIAATLWQASMNHSKANEAQKHDVTAAELQAAETEGETASQLVSQYVAFGDATILPQVQAHTSAGVTQLTSAIQLAGGDPNGFIDTGTVMVRTGGQAIALRQSGDTQGAEALLLSAKPQFDAYIAAQDQVVASEQQAAASAQSSADSARTATMWLAILVGVIATAIVMGGLVLVIRSARPGAIGTAPSV
jgi:CHASE3 domain sensor protein